MACGMDLDEMPWSQSARSNQGVPASQRMRECIQIAWGSRAKPLRSLPWYLDLSQCISRSRGRPYLPCVTSNALFFFIWDCT